MVLCADNKLMLLQLATVKANNLVNVYGARLGLVNAKYVFFVKVGSCNFCAGAVAEKASSFGDCCSLTILSKQL